MEFTCLKEDLQKGVQIVERIVSTRSTLPIIGNFLFEVGKNGFKISANNLEVGVEIMIKAEVSREGAILLPAKTLASIVSKLPPGKISFQLKERGIVNLSYKKSKFNIHALPADEFPHIAKVKEEKSFQIQSEVLNEMITQTIFASSSAEDKYVLNGVLFEIGKKESELRLVATDGYRLACRSNKISEANGEGLAIIPNRALAELNRILALASGENVKVTVSREHIAFRLKDYYLVSRLIQGQFPDYKQVIPKKAETKIKISTEQFLGACERAQVIAASVANIVRIESSGNEVSIAATAPDVGNIEEVIQAEASGQDKKAVAFNVRLIIDSLKIIQSEEVVLELGSALSPGLIRPQAGKDYVYIVMPIRTQDAVSA